MNSMKYEKITDLLINHYDALNTIIEKNINYSIDYKWENKDTLHYFAFSLSNPDIKIRLTELYDLIYDNSRASSEIYNFWMNTFVELS